MIAKKMFYTTGTHIDIEKLVCGMKKLTNKIKSTKGKNQYGKNIKWGLDLLLFRLLVL